MSWPVTVATCRLWVELFGNCSTLRPRCGWVRSRFIRSPVNGSVNRRGLPEIGRGLSETVHVGEGKILGDDSSPTVGAELLSLIHISEPTRLGMISYAV